MTDTPTPDTTPAAVDAMEKALPCPFCGATPHRGPGKVEHCQLHGEPFQRFSVWCPRGHAKITGRNESAAREEWNMRAPSAAEAAAMLREVARERDARTIGEEVAFNQRNMALDALKAAEAEAAALREALREIEALEIDWRLSTAENMRAASRIARAALKVSGHD